MLLAKHVAIILQVFLYKSVHVDVTHLSDICGDGEASGWYAGDDPI